MSENRRENKNERENDKLLERELMQENYSLLNYET